MAEAVARQVLQPVDGVEVVVVGAYGRVLDNRHLHEVLRALRAIDQIADVAPGVRGDLEHVLVDAELHALQVGILHVAEIVHVRLGRLRRRRTLFGGARCR